MPSGSTDSLSSWAPFQRRFLARRCLPILPRTAPPQIVSGRTPCARSRESLDWAGVFPLPSLGYGGPLLLRPVECIIWWLLLSMPVSQLAAVVCNGWPRGERALDASVNRVAASEPSGQGGRRRGAWGKGLGREAGGEGPLMHAGKGPLEVPSQ